MRFLSGLILLVLAFHGLPAFGEEIPTGQPPVPANVAPATGILSTDNGYIDRSHTYFDRMITHVVTWFDDLFGDNTAVDNTAVDNAAVDNAAVDNTAVDNAAVDNAAVDNTAVDNTAVDNTAGQDNTTGRDTAKAEINKAYIRLKWSNELRAEKGEGLKYQNSFRAHVHLPRFEKRARLVIMEDTSTDAVAPIPSDPGTPIANTPTQTNSLRAANTELRYYVHETKTGYAFLAVGSRFVWLPETFARARILWRHTLGDNTFISPSLTPFWQDHVGFGITPQLDFEHLFSHNYIFLWSNSATLYKNRSGFLWGSEVSLSRILSPVNAIAFAVGATGSTRPSAVGDRFNMGVNNYKATVRYRRQIYRPWLFLELVPETNWRRVESAERKIVPAFTVRLEINSEGPRALLPVPQIVKEPLPIPVPFPGYDPEPVLR